MPFRLAELPESVKGYDKLALLLWYRSNSSKSRRHPPTMNHSFRNHISSFPYLWKIYSFQGENLYPPYRRGLHSTSRGACNSFGRVARGIAFCQGSSFKAGWKRQQRELFGELPLPKPAPLQPVHFTCLTEGNWHHVILLFGLSSGKVGESPS